MLLPPFSSAISVFRSRLTHCLVRGGNTELRQLLSCFRHERGISDVRLMQLRQALMLVDFGGGLELAGAEEAAVAGEVCEGLGWWIWG